MVNSTKTNFYLLFSLLTIIISIFFVLAAHVVTPTSKNVVEDVSTLYNITINNSDTLVAANITQVNITLPSSFTATASTNGTDALGTLTINGQTLSWANTTSLVLNLTLNSFWFNATASTPGYYNITVTTTNSTVSLSSNISILVNDTTAPATVQYVAPGETGNANISRTNIAINVSVTDNGVINTINISLFNSSRALINNSANSVLATNSKSLFANFTGLAQGVYYFNATVNDTGGNNNTASTITIRVDTTAPTVALISPNVSSSATTYTFSFNVTDTDGTGAQNCSLILDNSVINFIAVVDSTGATNTASNSSIAVGSHNWSVNCTDYANNVGNSSKLAFTVTAAAAAAATTESSSGSSGFPTYTAAAARLSSTEGYEITARSNWKINLPIKGGHSMTINSINAGIVSITILSTPQKGSLSAGETGKYDLDADGYYDLSVYVQSTTSGNAATLILKSINEQSPAVPAETAPEATDQPEETQPEPQQSPLSSGGINWGIIILVIIVVVVAVVLLLVKKKNSAKPKK